MSCPTKEHGDRRERSSRRRVLLWPGLDAELKQARLRRVLLDGDGEAGGPCCLHGVRACRGRPHVSYLLFDYEDIEGAVDSSEWCVPPVLAGRQ